MLHRRQLVTRMFAAGALAAAGSVQARAQQDAGTAWRFAFDAVEGGALPLSRYTGKVLLVVNTASRCGYTPQYKGLQALWDKYRDDGLVVVGVPSNDFAQEPGTNEDIKGFCGGTYGVTFPLAGKTSVQGPAAHPFYRWVSASLGPTAEPRWNFHKILVGRDGRAVAAYPSFVAPEDPRLVAAVEAQMGRSRS